MQGLRGKYQEPQELATTSPVSLSLVVAATGLYATMAGIGLASWQRADYVGLNSQI